MATNLSGEVAGYCDPRFAGVGELFRRNLDSGADVGASFCAIIDGEVVVDLWGGWADEARVRPWKRDTIVCVYSTTKTMTALVALVLADRGELDMDAPVARYWPEFAQNGKQGILVRHLLSHSAGLSGWAAPVTMEDVYDWDKACGLLAEQAPFWEPGTAAGYHALTQGHLVGEVVRRITGKSLGTFFRDEIAEPLDADFWIGLPPSEDERVAELVSGPENEVAPGFVMSDLLRNMATNPPIDHRDTRTRGWRGAEMPAGNGHGNARSIARVHQILANGGVVDGRRYLSEAGCRRAMESQFHGVDKLLGVPVHYGLGFGLPGAVGPLRHEDSFFWGGRGGSLAVIDMKNRASFGYAMNRLSLTTTGDERGSSLIHAVWDALGQP